MELRILRSDPGVIAILLAMPLILIVFLKNGLLPPAGHGSGADQAVPGMATLFGFFIVSYAGYAYYREHGWKTWERLLTTPISTHEIVLAKTIPYVILGSLQLAALLTVGKLGLGLSIRGSVVGLVALVLTIPICGTSLALMLVALTSNVQQLNTFANLTAVLFGGIGGAFAPVSTFPAWARVIAHGVPQFWAMEAFHQVVSGSSSFAAVLPNLLALWAFTGAFALAAVWRFDFRRPKRSYAYVV